MRDNLILPHSSGDLVESATNRDGGGGDDMHWKEENNNHHSSVIGSFVCIVSVSISNNSWTQYLFVGLSDFDESLLCDKQWSNTMTDTLPCTILFSVMLVMMMMIMFEN